MMNRNSALEQEVVAVLDRGEDQRADAGVAEHDLGHERAADDRAEREREARTSAAARRSGTRSLRTSLLGAPSAWR